MRGWNRVKEPVTIQSFEFWVKLIEMLQQNWALIDEEPEGAARVFFITDRSGVFDEMTFPSTRIAERSLRFNGFRSFAAMNNKAFLRPPSPPFHRATHPNGPIYSSGRFWKQSVLLTRAMKINTDDTSGGKP
jgi:hypothetical protein